MNGEAEHSGVSARKGSRLLFGEIAQDLGLVTAEQVAEALHLQNECSLRSPSVADKPASVLDVPRLGEILAARHELALRGIQKILLEQERRRDGLTSVQTPRLRRVGSYEILSVLGSGGMGMVYKARDTSSSRIVALKVLAMRLAADKEFVARFEREVRTTAGLSHPNIVSSYGSGKDAGRPYLAMEYVEGQTLGALLEDSGRLPGRRALEIVRAVATALSFAHAHGVVHRDIKPDNVLLGADGCVKLTDFGLAKLLREDQRLTQSGIAIGTPHYISPEQVAASRYIDHRADLYGLGAMLFHMVTGHIPFDGPNNNEIMLKHLNERVRDPRRLVPDISPGTAAVIIKLMAKRAADRYDTAGQLVEDIDLVLRSGKTRHAAAVRRPLRLKAPGCAASVVLLVLCVLWILRCSL